ncbi:Bifunctional DNA primase/polymerase, N-terminal (plasmid) [Tsukamurella tyrosinosolvens]|uniref:Bifunctional DNA primase/polymerase, N-terminal n=1 Tax=Tsukamurella tyrosinosolvens TaxID=57704 RepID=A0A1H4VHF3_TSUTY|nr:bifunctional DNA primase/polymerase [Tsukamurella tyrosinosolvens]KXO90972.1 hypothetical protein AXK58_21305 [Tsukamurella tyrosinosolvens]SEC80539.1 Bifunctional DNA primase/polymerase, N-terminal [Tsukamurella tyrosinosolvens]VEH90508.1 Bifunctional DNA primase/polymerase, N-terminal [Tsukamurella tyrosinosolvens]
MPLTPEVDAFAAAAIARMGALGVHLMPLKEGVKAALAKGWPIAPAYTADEALTYVRRGGNLGVNLIASRLIVLDAEDALATAAVAAAGFHPTVYPAKSQAPANPNPAKNKRGGSHTWLRVPADLDPAKIRSDRMGLILVNGGKIDVLANARYAVAPPSRLDEAPGYYYAPVAGGLADPSAPLTDIPEAPRWLFERPEPGQPEAPPSLVSLHGILAPETPYERMERSAASEELTAKIDAVSWDDWLAGDARLTPTGVYDGRCGCPEYYFNGADNNRSATLHDGCELGNGAHVWSGTMRRILGLAGEHFSRLDIAASLASPGTSRREVAARVGIELRSPSAPVGFGASTFEQLAEEADARGDTLTAENHRATAMFAHEAERRAAKHLDVQPLQGETQFTGAAVGADPNYNPFAGHPSAPRNPDDDGGGGGAAADGHAGAGYSPTPHPAAEQVIEYADDETGTIPEAVVVTHTDRHEKRAGSAEAGYVHTYPNVAFEKMPMPGNDELIEYPYPPMPEYVQPPVGAKTSKCDVLPPIVNRASHPYVDKEWIFYATPGLSQVAAAADSRGISRFGLLGSLLPRVVALIPPTVRLVPPDGQVPEGNEPTGAGTSVNLYSVLVGPPSSGKSVTLGAADALVPGVNMVPPGTGEGILKMFPRASNSSAAPGQAGDDVSDGLSTVDSYSTPSVLLNSDEIDIFAGEMTRQGTKTSGHYRSMWMGGDIGNVTSDKERHSQVAAHTYRFGIRLGAQPDACTSLFSEANRGTPQRFLWLPAQRMVRRGPVYPTRLQIETVYWFDGKPSMLPQTAAEQPPIWIRPPAAAADEMALEEFRSATANTLSPDGSYDYDANDDDDGSTAIAQRHALLGQLKVSVALAALDGLSAPQDVHWYAAKAVMDVREHVIRGLVSLTRTMTDKITRERGRDQGVLRASASASEKHETRERTRAALAVTSGVVANLRAGGATRTTIPEIMKLTTEAGATSANRAFLYEAVAQLVAWGSLISTPDKDAYMIAQAEPEADRPTPASGPQRPGPTPGAPPPTLSTIGA